MSKTPEEVKAECEEFLRNFLTPMELDDWKTKVDADMEESKPIIEANTKEEKIKAVLEYKAKLEARVKRYEIHIKPVRMKLSRRFALFCAERASFMASLGVSKYQAEPLVLNYESHIVSIADNGVFRWALACYRSKRRRREGINSDTSLINPIYLQERGLSASIYF